MKSLKQKIIQNLENSINEKEMDLLEKAFEFAEKSHSEQKRKSGEPFVNHPLRVALTISQMKLGINAVIASVLHDVVEDCEIPISEIKSQFNDEVSFLVNGLTKVNKIKYTACKKEDDTTEKENFRNMILAMAKDLRIILIKLADRLDNMKTLWPLGPKKKRKKSLETLEILAPLAYRLGMSDIGAQLEDLAFPYVYEKEYKLTKKIVGKRSKELKNYLQELVPLVQEKLKNNNLKPEKIQFRTKHLYSIWRKLQKEDMDIKSIHDLVAMRIIMPHLKGCYGALGIIHQMWKPVPGRFKDYIALPKPNGYQSLHTTVFAKNGRIVEIQIRTPLMDEEAEWGIAAHWIYGSQKDNKKYKKGKKFNPPKSFYWINQLREWQKKFYGSKEFLNSLKVDFFKDRIFVLTPKGDIIDLPDGATTIDFAYQIHTDVGNQAAGAKINNRLVSLDYKLQSGEVIEIITKKRKLPSSSWLEFVKMSGTRKKIQDALKGKDSI
ncbi:MAG: bifunctional (p)ppGpp synthetase/guanosine-3',5'-bis(diphosphate) 3'-pyrophosphohydrolase [Candidatus Pacebacteria bacterium]|nr:bifunctional (p)ppGpp synthetase/guanosine-3',5'-bis(diphosphate) 3'-pyrophosphohydrolase [Candidatus Paceibacterota bacterium]